MLVLVLKSPINLLLTRRETISGILFSFHKVFSVAHYNKRLPSFLDKQRNHFCILKYKKKLHFSNSTKKSKKLLVYHFNVVLVHTIFYAKPGVGPGHYILPTHLG